MTEKSIIQTNNAPAPVGPYSQAVQFANLVFLSGQIGINPTTMQLVSGGIEAQAEQVFVNLTSVAKAAGASLDKVVKFTIFLTNLKNFKTVNKIMEKHCQAPYPARSTFEVAALPTGAVIEIEAIIGL